jgi:hypothetical protein
MEPASGSIFDTYPRAMTITWSDVPNAIFYKAEILACNINYPAVCFSLPKLDNAIIETTATSFEFEFVGAQPGKWRIWGVDVNGMEGEKSAWSEFSFSR